MAFNYSAKLCYFDWHLPGIYLPGIALLLVTCIINFIEVLSTNSDTDVCDSTDSRSRPGTFSIDSLDALSPGSLPVITELDTDGGQPGGANRLNLEDPLEDEVLCEPGDGGDEAASMAVLSDPAIPLTSMLRKLSVKTDIRDLDVDGCKHGNNSQAAG